MKETPDCNDVQTITQLICELTRICSNKEHKFAESFNLSPTELKMMKLFANSSTYTVKELRVKLDLTSGRVTHIVTSLEFKKLLSRVINENDKRNIIIKLMPKAQVFLENLYKSYTDMHIEILKSIDMEQFNNMKCSLSTLVKLFLEWEEKQNINQIYKGK
jgi:DNA-binding MarR family transcriptional regulator